MNCQSADIYGTTATNEKRNGHSEICEMKFGGYANC